MKNTIALVFLTASLGFTALADPPLITSDTALRPQDEPAAIVDFCNNSKGVKKHWVNYTPDGYILTILVTSPIKDVNATMVRGYKILAQKTRSILESDGVQIWAIVFRSADGILIVTSAPSERLVPNR